MYFEGDGVEQYVAMAYVWADLAAANGHADGESLNDTSAEQLSDLDISLARQISSRCFQQGYQNCDR